MKLELSHSNIQEVFEAIELQEKIQSMIWNKSL